MIKRLMTLGAAGFLAACGAQVPDSNPNTGVGFSDYDQFSTERLRRDAELQAMRPRPVPDGQAIAADTLTVLQTGRTIGGQSPVGGVGGSTVQGTLGTSAAAATSPVAVETATLDAATAPDNPNISDEQSFDAVASRESIESDAERIERNRETFQVVAPTAIPERSSTGRPNVVAFALATSHPVGTQVYRRSGTSIDRFNRECAKYPSADRAQEAFLGFGGPQRDRRGMDPDGDGYACFWNPAPFRTARGG